MKIPEWPSHETQMARLGKHQWCVVRLIELSKGFPVMEIPLDHLNLGDKFEDLYLREMAKHIMAINNADLSFPIILDEDGEIMDGRHRIVKALVLGEKTIKAVRFDMNPYRCKSDDD